MSLSTAARSAFRRPIQRLALAALVALPMGLAAQPAAEARDTTFRLEFSTPQGRFAIGDREYRRDHWGPRRGYHRAVLPPHRIVRRLRHQGYVDMRGLTYLPDRAVYRVDAFTRRGQPVRLRVDARTGETLRVRYLDDRRGRRGGGRRVRR